MQILLHRGLLGECAQALELETIEPTLEPDEMPQDVVMMIGDCGLAADPGSRHPVDLGETWHEWTGLPFVFALWLLRAHVDADLLRPKLLAARAAAIAAGTTDGTDGAIYYEIGEDELRGLRRFHTEAAALDLADAAIEPLFLPATP